jgi:hypothetical protein
MPRFPTEENKIIELAQKVASGISNNAATFPNPPVSPASINMDLSDYFAKNNEIQLAKAELTHKTQEKNEILERISNAARDNVDYGVIIAKGDDAVLEEIGWGNRAAPTALQPPGQCRALEIIGQGAGYVRIDWKEPIEGGKVAAYKVQRSEDGGAFADAATVIESEAAIFNQPTGKKLTYQVVALNKAGEGMASNTVSLVL